MSSALILANGDRLGLVGRVAITRQDNDLTKPDSTQNSFTTTSTLADSAVVHKALEHAGEGTSTTRKPYQQLPATLETDGVELLPRALLQVQAYQPGAGFTVQVFGGNKSFYAALGDKKLADLNLSRFDHDFTPATIFAGLQRRADEFNLGFCYDLLDRGKGDPCEYVSPTDTTAGYYKVGAFGGEFYPSAFSRIIWEQIFLDAGFRWRGRLPAEFNREIVPPTKAFGYSTATRDANSLLAGWRHKLSEQIREQGGDWYRDAPYNYVGDSTYKAGAGVVFSASTGKATITTPGYYNIGGKVKVRLGCDSFSPGRVRCSIYLHVNGVQVAQDYLTTGSEAEDIIEARFEHYLLNAGDLVSVHLRGEELTNAYGPTGTYWRIGGGFFFGSPMIDNTITETTDYSFEVTLLEEFPHGGRVRLADWLPDMLQKDFIKSKVVQYALQQRPDPYLDIIEFTPVVELFNRLASAPTWDGLLDNSRRPKVAYQLSGFAQQNVLRWKEDKANPDSAAGLGDGRLACPDLSLDPKKDLVTMGFAASPAGANGLVLVPRWKLNANSNPATYAEQTPEPRVLLRSLTRSRTVQLFDDGDPNNPTLVGSATIPIAYFVESAGVELVDLDFARTLGPTYYAVLAAALAAPRMIRPYVRLGPDDVVNLDQLTPVWLEREGSFFYVNKIDQYEEGNTVTAVELIRLTI